MYPGKLAKAIEDHIIGCLIEELESFPRPDIKYPEVHRIKRIAELKQRLKVVSNG